jgi:uncharacterized RDD family membrane protein YckC
MIAATDPGDLAGPLLFVGMFSVAVPIAIGCFVFWICMLVSAIQNKGLTEGEKIAWVLVMVFVHCLGAILYFFIGHPKRHTPLAPPPRP